MAYFLPKSTLNSQRTSSLCWEERNWMQEGWNGGPADKAEDYFLLARVLFLDIGFSRIELSK